MHRLLTTSLVLLLLTPAVFLFADEAPNGPPARGDRIRLHAPLVADRTIAGRLLLADEDALVLSRDDGGVVSIPRLAIQDLQVARGRRSYAKRGAVIGAVVGTSVLFASYAADGFCDHDPACIIYAPVVSGAAGMFLGVVGAGVGAVVRTDRWVSVDPGRLKVTVAPTRRGVVLGLSIAF
jgi:hypothetical protein